MSDLDIPWVEKELQPRQSETLTIGPFKRTITLKRLLMLPNDTASAGLLQVKASIDDQVLKGSQASDFGGPFGTKVVPEDEPPSGLDCASGKTLVVDVTNKGPDPVLFKIALFATATVEMEDLA